MTRLRLFSLTAAIIGALAVASMSTSDASSGKPCSRKTFDTELVKNACAKGGQDEAKAAMKAFLKDAKKKNDSLACVSFHTKVGDPFPLRQDALKTFKDSGGK